MAFVFIILIFKSVLGIKELWELQELNIVFTIVNILRTLGTYGTSGKTNFSKTFNILYNCQHPCNFGNFWKYYFVLTLS